MIAAQVFGRFRHRLGRARGSLGSLAAGLDPGLSRTVWTLQAGMLVSSAGTGMVLPFLLIYLHNVRGFSLVTSGLVSGLNGGVALAGATLAGWLGGRVDGRRTMAAALVLLAVGYGLLSEVRHPWQAAALLALVGLGNGLFWPSQSSVLVGLVPTERRHLAFAVNRAVDNAGLGLGAVVGGLLAASGSLGGYTTLFVADAATFVVLAFVLPLVPAPRRAPEPRPSDGEARPREYARRRVVLGFAGLNVLLFLAGYGQFEATLPVFAKNTVGVGERAIGVVFLLNLLVCVVAQLPVARLLEGHRRMRALALVAVLWAAVWLGVDLTGVLARGSAAFVALGLAAVAVAIGECCHAPLQTPVFAGLAPPERQGQYLALSTISVALGLTLGPPLGATLLAASPQAPWLVAAGILVAVGAGALALERGLPEAVRVTPSSGVRSA